MREYAFYVLFSAKEQFTKRVLILTLLTAIMPFAASGQTNTKKAPIKNRNAVRNGQQQKPLQQTITPIADYHAHISSIEISKGMIPSLQPIIQLPEDLARVIRERESYAERDVSGIFTKDALVFDARHKAWVRGREKAREFLQVNRPGLRFLPVEFKIDGSAGFIAGYTRLGDDPKRNYARHVLFVLRKEEGEWRIASEISTDAPNIQKAATAKEYIAELDAAGVKRGVILSSAFVFGTGAGELQPNEYEKVKTENDWIVEQVSLYPDRLVAFCGFNPIKDYALEELRRCAKIPQIKGLKFHFEDSGVDLRKPEHLEKVRQIFKAANEARLPIVAHVSTGETRRTEASGKESSEIFLNQILTVAPDIKIQLAHIAGHGTFEPVIEAAFEVFGDAISAGDRRTKNIYFDISGGSFDKDTAVRLVRRMRRVGMNRFLFGSDRSGSRNPPPGEAWKVFRNLPLTEDEFRIIAGNIMPWLR